MNTFEIDFANVNGKQEAHELIASVLSFPCYYGHNLDALYDCLREIRPCSIRLKNVSALGEYGESLVEVFQDAATDRSGKIEILL